MGALDTTVAVGFRKGLQANLPTDANCVEGVFYLTTDTDRLYVGGKDSSNNKKLRLLNSTIRIYTDTKAVASSGDTFAEGDFIYLSGLNVLAYHNGAATNPWNFINQDTKVSDFTSSVTVSGNAATIESVVATSNSSGSGTEYSATETINVAGGITIAAANQETETDGTTSYHGITLTGDTYTLSNTASSNNATTVKLASKNGQGDTSVAIKGTAGEILVTADTTNGITLGLDSANFSIGTLLGSVSSSVDSTGHIITTITDKKNGELTSAQASSAQIKYTITDSDSKTTTYYPGADLPVYTKTDIDTKFKNLNGLTYIGTIGSSGTYKLSSSYTVQTSTDSKAFAVHNGDMFLVSNTSSGTITYASGKTAKNGDLLIATGTEGTDGTLSTITWTYVPSGDDTYIDTNYSLVPTASTVSTELTASGGAATGSIKVASGNADSGTDKAAITVTGTVSGNDLTATVTHKTVSATITTPTATSNSTSVDAISAIAFDSTGHIKSYTTQKYNLASYALDSLTTAAITNGISTTITAASSGNVAAGSVTQNVTSTSLKLANATGNNGYSIDLFWGSF